MVESPAEGNASLASHVLHVPKENLSPDEDWQRDIALLYAKLLPLGKNLPASLLPVCHCENKVLEFCHLDLPVLAAPTKLVVDLLSQNPPSL